MEQNKKSFLPINSQFKRLIMLAGIFCFANMIVFASTSSAASFCEMIFGRKTKATANKLGASFLQKKDPRLHTTHSIERAVQKYKRATGQTLKKPTDKLEHWLNSWESLIRKAQRSEITTDTLKSIIYSQYVIRFEDIPNSYYEMQSRIDRDRGLGNTTYTKEEKTQRAEAVIADQVQSLDYWADYLISKDTDMYPVWLKYWMFTGMTKLSKYKVETSTFSSRSKDTTAPYADLNREALAYVADMVLKKLNKQSLQEITDPHYLELLDEMSFSKLYGRTLFNLGVGQQGNFKTNQGRWIVFPQGSDHMPLVKSLVGRNTGWCTAGESTAQSQLSEGDFHVFYSLDENGQATIPRVAIRMKHDQIAEVRGVAKDQNLDPQISQSDVVKNKMEEFGRKAEDFKKRDHDMKLLTSIVTKDDLGQKLSKEDLKFLYEIESEIRGFGYAKDPRISQILRKRDPKDDLIVIFDRKYKRDEISTTEEEFVMGRTKLHYGDLDLYMYTSGEGLVLPEVLLGSLYLSRVTKIERLMLPRILNGNIDLSRLTVVNELIFPKTLNGDVYLNKLTSARRLILSETLNGSVNLSNISSAKGVVPPKILNGDLYLNGLTSPRGLILPSYVDGDIYLSRLSSLQGVPPPKTLNGNLYLSPH